MCSICVKVKHSPKNFQQSHEYFLFRGSKTFFLFEWLKVPKSRRKRESKTFGKIPAVIFHLFVILHIKLLYIYYVNSGVHPFHLTEHLTCFDFSIWNYIKMNLNRMITLYEIDHTILIRINLWLNAANVGWLVVVVYATIHGMCWFLISRDVQMCKQSHTTGAESLFFILNEKETKINKQT